MAAHAIAADAPVRIAVDIGGTFTDVQILDEATGLARAHKTATTPADPSIGLLTGISEAAERFGFGFDQVSMLIHGTTIATNAVLEQKLPAGALVTTAGFEDVLEIGRHMRRDIYASLAEDRLLLIPRARRLGVVERITADGRVATPLDPASLDAAIDRLAELEVETTAICCLHAHITPDHEQAIAARIADRLPDMHLSLSSDISPEFREFERSSTTVLNALLMPVVGAYLSRLEARLATAGFNRPVYLVQSNGGVARPAVAAREPARLLLSGPSGGALAAETLAGHLDLDNLVAVDMGGTSYDVSLIQERRTRMIAQGEVGGCPVRLPMVEMRTIGAGGGSLAGVDAVGALYVGPESAGATPGPAAYGQGGDRPTVTDANVTLGRIAPARFLGGAMTLHADAARRAVETRVAKPAQLTTEAAASGILTIATAHMASAIRLSLFEKGLDPSDFTLAAFGGAGGLHACETAADLAMRRVLFPGDAGTLSAWGMLYADLRHDLIRAFSGNADDSAIDGLTAAATAMIADGNARLDQDGIAEADRDLALALDLRYRGQAYEITVALATPADLAGSVTAFHQAHQAQYAHSDTAAVPEIVNLRLTSIGRLPKPRPAEAPGGGGGATATDRVYLDDWAEIAVFARADIAVDAALAGPLLVEDQHTSLFIPPGWTLRRVAGGALIADHDG